MTIPIHEILQAEFRNSTEKGVFFSQMLILAHEMGHSLGLTDQFRIESVDPQLLLAYRASNSDVSIRSLGSANGVNTLLEQDFRRELGMAPRETYAGSRIIAPMASRRDSFYNRSEYRNYLTFTASIKK